MFVIIYFINKPLKKSLCNNKLKIILLFEKINGKPDFNIKFKKLDFVFFLKIQKQIKACVFEVQFHITNSVFQLYISKLAHRLTDLDYVLI